MGHIPTNKVEIELFVIEKFLGKKIKFNGKIFQGPIYSEYDTKTDSKWKKK